MLLISNENRMLLSVATAPGRGAARGKMYAERRGVPEHACILMRPKPIWYCVYRNQKRIGKVFHRNGIEAGRIRNAVMCGFSSPAGSLRTPFRAIAGNRFFAIYRLVSRYGAIARTVFLVGSSRRTGTQSNRRSSIRNGCAVITGVSASSSRVFPIDRISRAAGMSSRCSACAQSSTPEPDRGCSARTSFASDESSALP